jgi:crotonobetainyl-CoA:carnitine CoA-transferase CaiB-like acyl-CoA transferase
MARPDGAPTALSGVLVVDFTRVIAGPMCTQLLADLGARVIKIENPDGGDDTRHISHATLGGETASFLTFNRGKRSVALDLTRPEGRDVALELIRKADVVVENFTTGVMERLGLGYETVAETNPKLVYCSVSAYGRTGAFARRAGYDPVVQAESGLMSLNGYTDRPPVRIGPPVIDLSTGILACNAVLAALLARQHLGRGQRVEVSLFDTATALTSMFAMGYLMSGKNPARFGQAPRGAAPVGLFEASDGVFYLACVNNRVYRRLVVDGLGRPDLADDPRFATNTARTENREALDGVLAEIFARRSCAEWMSTLQTANVPAGPLRSIAEAIDSAEMRDRGVVTEIPHPTAGRVPNIAPPFRFSATPPVDPMAAPLLGEHTREVLSSLLGYDDGQLAGLADAGIFGDHRPNVGVGEGAVAKQSLQRVK